MKINGLPVTDASKKLAVHITKRDVSLGATKDPGGCAAARAIVRQTGCQQARVHIGRTYIKFDNKWVRYATPPALRSEIVAFDRGGDFEPGDYTLHAIPPAKQKGIQQGTAHTKSKYRAGAPKRHNHILTGVHPHGANK